MIVAHITELPKFAEISISNLTILCRVTKLNSAYITILSSTHKTHQKGENHSHQEEDLKHQLKKTMLTLNLYD